MVKKIKSIKQCTYEAIFNFGEITKGARIDKFPGDNTYELYNENGELLEEGYLRKVFSFKCPDLFHRCIENEQGQIICEYNYRYDVLFATLPESIVINAYNDENKLIEKLTYKIDNKVTTDEWFKAVDKDGDITPTSLAQLNAILKERAINKYDDNNNLIESREYDEAKNLTYKETWAYNSKGQKIERVEYETEDKIDTKYVYIYDEGQFDGEIRLLEIKNFDSKNIPKGETFNIYDEQGRLVEVKVFSKNGIIVDRMLFKYHEYEVSQEVHYLDSDGNLDHKMIYKYNLNDSLIEEGVYNPDGSLYSMESNIYDEKERVIESRWIEFAKEFIYTSKKYEYDEFDNWIKCIEFDKDIPVKIIEREIEYY